MALEVLVADNQHKDYIANFQRAFNGSISFTTVSNGGLAFRAVQEKPYQIIMMDYDLPGGAFQAAFKIKSIAEKVKILGYSRSDDPKQGWSEEDKGALGMAMITTNMMQIAWYLARSIGIDDKTFERDIKTYFR